MSWVIDAKYASGGYVDRENDAEARASLDRAVSFANQNCGCHDLFLPKGGVHGSAAERVWLTFMGSDRDGGTLSDEDVKGALEKIVTLDPNRFVDPYETVAYWSIRALLDCCAQMGFRLEVNL